LEQSQARLSDQAHDRLHTGDHSHAANEPEDWQSPHYVYHWIEAAQTHDEERLPLLRRTANFIPFAHSADIRVLDLGTGYGALAQQVLELFPASSVVCHDFSDLMIDYAREKLAWAGERVSFAKADLLDPDWARDIKGPFDAVVASLTVFYLEKQRRVEALYREIFPLVWAKGAFLSYDVMPARGPLTFHAFQRDRAFMSGAEAPPPGRLAPREPVPSALENHLRWLRDAGFIEADCLWKERQNAIIGGFRR
jgi:tRNA (cmo5U34)-methyltransferase